MFRLFSFRSVDRYRRGPKICNQLMKLINARSRAIDFYCVYHFFARFARSRRVSRGNMPRPAGHKKDQLRLRGSRSNPKSFRGNSAETTETLNNQTGLKNSKKFLVYYNTNVCLPKPTLPPSNLS